MSTADLVCIGILLVILTVGTTLKLYTKRKLQQLDGVSVMLVIEPKKLDTAKKRSKVKAQER